MSDYFYIKNNKIIGSGQAKILNEDIVSYEVSEDMVCYNEEPTWESERYKWKYKWDGEKIIDNPDFEEEEKNHYNEAMRQARSEAYTGRTDYLISRKLRKQAIGDWTLEDESEFIEQITSISEEIKNQFPYRE